MEYSDSCWIGIWWVVDGGNSTEFDVAHSQAPIRRWSGKWKVRWMWYELDAQALGRVDEALIRLPMARI